MNPTQDPLIGLSEVGALLANFHRFSMQPELGSILLDLGVPCNHDQTFPCVCPMGPDHNRPSLSLVHSTKDLENKGRKAESRENTHTHTCSEKLLA